MENNGPTQVIYRAEYKQLQSNNFTEHSSTTTTMQQSAFDFRKHALPTPYAEFSA